MIILCKLSRIDSFLYIVIEFKMTKVVEDFPNMYLDSKTGEGTMHQKILSYIINLTALNKMYGYPRSVQIT